MSDQIYILMPDQSIRSVKTQTGEMKIGRDPDNEIVIDHPSVSRLHARLEFDGEHYTVSDLGSLNGTFIENVELAPTTPQPWLPGENLRIGEIWLRLEHASQARTTQTITSEDLSQSVDETLPQLTTILYKPDGEAIRREQLKTSPSKGWIGVLLESHNLTVSPGSGIIVSLLIYNLSTAADQYQVQLEGLPADWYTRGASTGTIQPERSTQYRLKITPPRTPASKAGRYPCKLRVSSQTDPTEVAVIRMSLTVSAFSQFSSVLRPEQLPSDGRGQVIIRNEGNLPETFTVNWEDPRGDLSFEPPATKVTVPPAQSARIEFRVDALRPPIYGKGDLYTFISHIRSPAGKLESHPGQYFGQALIPIWAPIALVTLCAVVACMLVYFVNTSTAPSRTATALAAADHTRQAHETQAIFAAQTATENARLAALQGTGIATTATATWQMADTDGDGLSNAQELQLFTKPDDPDTDKDGLNDGDEVNQWNTFPLIPDTDGDGLIDGEEVNNRKTDPLNKDTDGDGIEDSLDPDPLKAPTPSFTPTRTRTPLPSDTPTPTTTPSISPTPTISPTTRPTSTDLVISITNGQASSVPGTNIAYTIVVVNDGSFPIENVEVEDNFPSSLTNITWSCSGEVGSTCEDTAGTGDIHTRLDMGGNGKVTFIVNATIHHDANGLLLNSARVLPPPDITDTNTINNLAIDSDTLTPQVSFEFSKTDHLTSIGPGEDTEYTINLINNGPSSVNGVTILDNFPQKLEDVSWSCTSSIGATCISSGGQTGDINLKADLDPGGSIIVTARAVVSAEATGVITNTASLVSPISPGINNQNVTDTTDVTSQTDLQVSVDAPSVVSISAQVDYYVEIVNNGPSYASSVTLVNQVPPEGLFPTSDPGSPICTRTGELITCNLGDLAPGDSTQVRVVLIAPSQQALMVFHASVTTSETDPDMLNNAVTVEVQVN